MKIKKGRHSYFHIPMLNFGSSVSKTFTFNSPIEHDLGYPDQLDWNKLFGVAFIPTKHTNSYRIAWRYVPTTKQIELGAYYYQKGVLYKDLSLGFISTNTPYKGVISYSNGTVTFSIYRDNVPFSSLSVQGKWQFIGWKLYPYFGGNKPAPIDISIKID